MNAGIHTWLKAEGIFTFVIADFFRRDVRDVPAIHARCVVMEGPHRGAQLHRAFHLEGEKAKWLELLRTACGSPEFDVLDDVAVTKAIVGIPFVGTVVESKPVAKRSDPTKTVTFHNIVGFRPPDAPLQRVDMGEGSRCLPDPRQ